MFSEEAARQYARLLCARAAQLGALNIGIGSPQSSGIVHHSAVGRKTCHAFIGCCGQLPLKRFRSLPPALLVLLRNPYVAPPHTGYLAF
jgi:hypothetical protein